MHYEIQAVPLEHESFKLYAIAIIRFDENKAEAVAFIKINDAKGIFNRDIVSIGSGDTVFKGVAAALFIIAGHIRPLFEKYINNTTDSITASKRVKDIITLIKTKLLYRGIPRRRSVEGFAELLDESIKELIAQWEHPEIKTCGIKRPAAETALTAIELNALLERGRIDSVEYNDKLALSQCDRDGRTIQPFGLNMSGLQIAAIITLESIIQAVDFHIKRGLIYDGAELVEGGVKVDARRFINEIGLVADNTDSKTKTYKRALKRVRDELIAISNTPVKTLNADGSRWSAAFGSLFNLEVSGCSGRAGETWRFHGLNPHVFNLPGSVCTNGKGPWNYISPKIHQAILGGWQLGTADKAAQIAIAIGLDMATRGRAVIELLRYGYNRRGDQSGNILSAVLEGLNAGGIVATVDTDGHEATLENPTAAAELKARDTAKKATNEKRRSKGKVL